MMLSLYSETQQRDTHSMKSLSVYVNLYNF